MKRMDWLLPLLAIVFIISGTALGAYLTYNFRKKSEELTDKNILLTDELKSLVQDLKTFQTGGDSYCEISYYYSSDTQTIDLLARTVGNHTMRNVEIQISDNLIEKGKRQEFGKVNEFIRKNAEWNYWKGLTIKVGDIKTHTGIHITQFDYNDYNDDIDFTIVVDSENFTTQQNLIAYNISNPKLVKEYSKIFIQRGGDGGKTLSENVKRFPLNDKGIPIRKSKK